MNQFKTAVLIGALEDILPEFEWEDIATGGGCTAIWGKNPNHESVIMITDGNANSPENFAEDAIAIYWKNENMEDYCENKPWTDSKPFFELLGELKADVETWETKKHPHELLTFRLNELAMDIEKEAKKYSFYGAEMYVDDIRTAIYLINTHTTQD